jgi:hypothetical protein
VRLTPDWVEAIGTWFGGLSTAGALWAAWASLRNERRTRITDVERLRQEEHLARQARARSVVLHNPHLDDTAAVYRITLGNYSEYPVTGVVATISYHPHGEEAVPGFPKFIPVLPAQESTTLEWSLLPEFGDEDESREPPRAQSYAVELLFLDVHGVAWESGTLRQATVSARSTSTQPEHHRGTGVGGRLRAASKALRRP